ncbi:MAG: TonB-dependent receptor, partial [Candidatus Saccharibacteria bacterium]|nr:TonB-dependent receptor [Rhodoferax sp.]
MAQDNPAKAPTLPDVVVTGSQTDTEARKEFVAGKIIIGRKRIEDSGLQNVAELLRREPAITYGKDGRIGLMGLPGYTQVLVDGAPPSGGDSLNELKLTRVEKIEIVKSTMAEFGPYSIAGTINIVTRKIAKKTNSQFSVGASTAADASSTSIGWSTNQTEEGSPWSYRTEVNASRGTSTRDKEWLQTVSRAGMGEVVQWRGTENTRGADPSFSATGSIDYKPDARNTFNVSTTGSLMQHEQNVNEIRNWLDGRFDASQQHSMNSLLWWSLPLKWSFHPDEKSSLELNWNSNRISLKEDIFRAERGTVSPAAKYNNSQRRDVEADSLKLDYKVNLPDGHTLKTGGTMLSSRVRGSFSYRVNGAPDPSLDALGTQSESSETQLRLFAQDDWELDDTLALNLGLSSEARRFAQVEGQYRNDTRTVVWSPSVHVAKKLDEDGDRQLRFSIGQAYKLPSSLDVTARPQIHPRALCAANAPCGANTLETADIAGNPQLLPQRSFNLNVSYEHSLGSDSQIAVEYFVRSIDRLVGTDITLESVPWANVPRYVARPSNLGQALVQGIDVELQLALREFWKTLPAIELRGSLGLAQSTVSSVPGPDNRLDSQSPWSAKLSASYAAKDLPLKLDVDASWLPSGGIRKNASQRVYTEQLFRLSANANWKLSNDARLVFKLDNLLAKSSQRVDDYFGQDEVT